MERLKKKDDRVEEHTSKLFYELFSAFVEYQRNEQEFKDYKNFQSQLESKARSLGKGESNYDERILVAGKIRELEHSLEFIYDRFILASVKLTTWTDKIFPGQKTFTFMDMGWKKALTKVDPSDILFLRVNGFLRRGQTELKLIQPWHLDPEAVHVEDLRH